MKTYLPAITLAAAMIAVAGLSVFDLAPKEVARYSPFLLLALFPGAWLRADHSCSLLRRNRA